MDTNRIKRFATEARNVLMQGVTQRFIAVGFNADGGVDEEPMPVEGGCVFMGEVQSTEFYNKWMSLKRAVLAKGINEVAEEAAYTWFNRMVAIRIMVKNELASPVLEYESVDARVPYIVADARHGMLPDMDESTRLQLGELLEDDSKTSEQFRMLIVAYCHSNRVIDGCFGHIADYTELLLPNNILAEGGFVDMLNNTEFVTDEDYHSPELIGWLYQFYISEKKDDVFANFKRGLKAEAKDIPAATQIFTPNWIVKYMVQNTVGRIYLDNNPYSDIKDSMRYLVEPQKPTPNDAIISVDDLHKLTCADLACGSGHILNECFDLLYQCYLEEGNSRRQAVEDIFKYNLTGIDLDTRAKQLAQFALLLKACQKDSSFKDAHCMPRVYDMPEPYDDFEHIGRNLKQFLMGEDSTAVSELTAAFRLMDDAKNLGSIMKFKLSERTRNMVAVRMEEYEGQDIVSEEIRKMMPYMWIIMALTENYAALVMNPPYMGNANMNGNLAKYVKDNYEDYKSDLFAVFMKVAEDRLLPNAKYGMINMQSWMFLSSFEKLRTHVIDNIQIDNMLHLGPRTFDEIGGEVVQNTAFVISNAKPSHSGYYFRLVDFAPSDLKQINFLNCCDAIRSYGDISKMKINLSPYCFNVSQSNFKKIPGCPIGYWVSENVIVAFGHKKIRDYANVITGMTIGDNNKYLRLWHEVSNNKLALNFKTMSNININKTMWIPYSKGGARRQWYGNHDYVVNWLKKDSFNRAKTTLSHLYLQEALTWPFITSGNFSCRYLPHGSLWDVAGSPCFFDDKKIQTYTLGFLASKITNYILPIINPTINVQAVDINNLPLILTTNIEEIGKTIDVNISISKQDWDAHETSWDFKENELIRVCKEGKTSDLQFAYGVYKKEWTEQFKLLHANEEKLNRQFIEIYGLQDELTPDVPLEEITILQEGEISIENDEVVWHADVVMKQLISYAMGCIMGRYSIDKPGLILANQGDGLDEYKALVSDSRFEVDDDGIIPLMPSSTEFTDCATKRFKAWLAAAFGEEWLMDNLNFVEQSIGKNLDDYFVKDYWKDHKKMYQNRPIYWLFSSKKGAFQCLVYMHRMTPYTAEAIRTKYLLPHIEWLVNKQNEMEANAANLTPRERKELDVIRKQIEECREYHDRLHVVADQMIAFDLDDGVVVNYAKFGDVLGKIK